MHCKNVIHIILCVYFVLTGMQTFDTVKFIYETVKSFHSDFVIMHCVSSYPAPPDEINLNVIKLYKKEFPDINIGYSGHELGMAISVAAVALGAKVNRLLSFNPPLIDSFLTGHSLIS